MGDDKDNQEGREKTKTVAAALAAQRTAFHGYVSAETGANTGFSDALAALAKSREALQALPSNPIKCKS